VTTNLKATKNTLVSAEKTHFENTTKTNPQPKSTVTVITS